MLYNNRPLHLPACAKNDTHYKDDASLCTLQAFMAAAERVIPENYDAECQT